MCTQWIASASCTAAVYGHPRKGCKGAHVVVSRRQVCPDATEPCVCFFGSCGRILTLFSEDDNDGDSTSLAPCDVCGVDEDPHQMLLMKIFDMDFAQKWVEFYGETHWKLCTETKWLGLYERDGFEDDDGSEGAAMQPDENTEDAAGEAELDSARLLEEGRGTANTNELGVGAMEREL